MKCCHTYPLQMGRAKFPLYISQDGKVPKPAVASLAQSYGSRGVRYLHHKEQSPPRRLLNPKENLAYYRIANHYKFMLRTFFDCFGYSRLIILEVSLVLVRSALFLSSIEVRCEQSCSVPSCETMHVALQIISKRASSH